MFARHRFGVAVVVALTLLVVATTVLHGQQSSLRPPEPYPQGRTIEITYIQQGGPAYRAGLEVGDRIIEVNGVRVEGIPAFQHALLSAGYSARLTVFNRRNSEVVSVHVYPSAGRIGVDARVVTQFWPPY